MSLSFVSDALYLCLETDTLVKLDSLDDPFQLAEGDTLLEKRNLLRCRRLECMEQIVSKLRLDASSKEKLRKTVAAHRARRPFSIDGDDYFFLTFTLFHLPTLPHDTQFTDKAQQEYAYSLSTFFVELDVLVTQLMRDLAKPDETKDGSMRDAESPNDLIVPFLASCHRLLHQLFQHVLVRLSLVGRPLIPT